MKLIKLLIVFLLCSSFNVSALDLSSKSAVLYEPVTDRIIYQKNSDIKMPMASTTKIATAITVIENCDLSEVVTVSKLASETEGSSIWLEENEHMTVSDMLYGLMLSSGNDAAVALSEHISSKGEDFILLMNETAKKAGCTNTNFENPSGLDLPEHYTTASDLAKLSSYAMKNEKFSEIVKTKQKKISWESSKYDRVLKNHNKLLNLYDGCNGIKTGYTKKDGRCLVSSAKRYGISLIAVTLNAPDDWNDHIKMLDYGFSVLKQEKIIDKSQKFLPLKVSDGALIELSYKNDIILPLVKEDKIETKTVITRVVPPVKIGDVLGYTIVYLNGSEIAKADIISKTEFDYPNQRKIFTYINLIINTLIY